MANVRIDDNGAAYMISVDGLIVAYENSLGNAWRHVEWMYRVASQIFTVGQKEILVTDWVEGMKKAGYLD